MKSFVKSPIGYCTLVWMFHGWTVKKKKQTFSRALLIANSSENTLVLSMPYSKTRTS